MLIIADNPGKEKQKCLNIINRKKTKALLKYEKIGRESMNTDSFPIFYEEIKRVCFCQAQPTMGKIAWLTQPSVSRITVINTTRTVVQNIRGAF